MDEKGFLMGVALRWRMIWGKDRRGPKLTQDGSLEWGTVIETISGDGEVLRPMIINKGQAHYMGWYAKLNKKDTATFGVSGKGWSNEKLELQWLQEVFDFETREK